MKISMIYTFKFTEEPKWRCLLLCICILFSISACTTQVAPQPISISEPTKEISTLTPISAVTSTPLIRGSLNQDGPWFVYNTVNEGFFAVNQDGSGKTKVQISFKKEDLMFAYESDTYHILAINVAGTNMFDHTLYLVSVPEINVLQTIDRFAYAHEHSDFTVDGSEYLLDTPVWSPNGRYMAYSAMIDDPTYDLYIFDAETNQITKVHLPEYHACRFVWSPNSEWLVFEQIRHVLSSGTEAIWQIKPDGSALNKLFIPEDSGSESIMGWINETQYLSYDMFMGSMRNIRLTDLSDASSTILFEGEFFESPVYDQRSNSVIFKPYFEETINPDSSYLHTLSISDATIKKVELPGYNIFFDEQNRVYYNSDAECHDGSGTGGFEGLDMEGNPFCVVPFETTSATPTPDKEWMILSQPKYCLVNEQQSCIYAFENWAYGTYWRPDDDGLFLTNAEEIYYKTLDAADPILIEDHLGFTDSHWVSQQILWLGQ